ncbi:mannose-6-phosphate isomerase, class I [Furfurilactobacillus milii]|uniref:Mannose-6-phosphate isomerase n=1 Tax=Furfurilactobacillus milii TaxID=2888272 RepID=A0A6N9I4N2_9LACO|nr:mannose-6-phosphate isomerase, class I [Furfurilactobacillus milii]MYV17920.1 mannose-6-phosphate isomerase, class I [Furfurilactobacillus milii]
MTEPMFMIPVFHEKIWGGTGLHDRFNYDIPTDHTGEAWAISAHPHGPATVVNGEFKGESLDTIWAQHREVFGNAKGDVFPLLTKILDAHEDLSVQVHPDDAYAEEHEHELGKTECWYVIAAEPGAKLYYGHHAQTREQLADWINNDQWDKLFRTVPVKAGDFFYVPSGTIHALGAGIMVLETQQSSDTTYRVYDWDRTDAKGRKRPLHKQQSIDVTTVPHVDPKLDITKTTVGKATITKFVASEFFAVYEWRTNGGEAHFSRGKAPYTLASVLNGRGELIVPGEQPYTLVKGMHFIIPFGIKEWTVKGDVQIIASEPGAKA